MVRIRLRREGKKGQPSFRIVAADRESPRDGRFLEILGHYNPRTEPSTIFIKEDRVYDWISRGAQPSESVWQIFRQSGTDERIKRFKAGEDVEVLLEEAEAARKEVDPRTRPVERHATKAVGSEAPAQKQETQSAQPAQETEKPESSAVEDEAGAQPGQEAEEALEAKLESRDETQADLEAEADTDSDAEGNSEGEVQGETESGAESDEAAAADAEAEAGDEAEEEKA